MMRVFLLFLLAAHLTPSAGLFDGWGRKCAITIQSVVGVGALTDFPVLLTASNFPAEALSGGANSALNGGGDLRFTADVEGTIRLPVEVVTFVTGVSPSAQVYVKLPNVPGSSAIEFWVWYKKAGATQPAVSDPYGRNAVWDNDYAGVWHLEEDPEDGAGAFVDATGNGNAGTGGNMTSSWSVAAQVGKGIDFKFSVSPFEAEADINVGSSATLDNIANMTYEMIMNPRTEGENSLGRLYAKNNASGDGKNFFVDQVTCTRCLSYAANFSGQRGWWRSPSESFAFDEFSHAAMTYDNSAASAPAFYIDGISLSVTEVEEPDGTTVDDASGNGHIGNRESLTRQFDGVLDEVRISSVIRSADWMRQTARNLMDPASFAVAGSPIPVSPVSGIFLFIGGF